jgi:peroxiredoxin
MEKTETREPDRPATLRRRRGFLRTWVYPLAVIAIIVGVIWYIEYRPDGARSPSGELYGPADLPPALVPEGAKVAAEEGALAPDFLLEQLEGPDVRLSDFRGKAVVLNFWATWCDPCRKEMPQFVQAYDEHKEHGLEIVAVNLQEGKEISQRFVDDYGMDFTVVVDRDGEVGDRYRILGLPTTYFIDREGEIRSAFTGPFLEEQNGTDVADAIDESELEERIAEILASPEASS